jgi:TP901 family phage tail tape measure protein
LADVNSNININFDTTAALAQLRALQAGLSRFHQTLAEGNLAAANAQKGLNAQLIQSIGATGKFSASQVKVAGSTLAFTSALEKNKLSLREYYRYTMAAATANTRVLGRAFAEEREIINRARRDRVKALQAQYIQMNKSNAGFMDAIRVMPKSLQMASGKFTELGTRIQYAAQRQQFLNQLLKQGSTQLLNFGKNTQWAGRQLMVGLTMPLALFGAAAAKAFRELDAEVVKFRRVYGDAFTNDAEVEAAVQNIKKLGSEYVKYGVSVTKTMEMAATAAAAGFQGDDLSAQVKTATKLAVLGQIEQQQALETTISLQSAFGISSDELAKKIDFLNAVENQTLLSIEDLTIAIPKAAPVVKQLGGNVEDLAFFLTAMKEGGINASEGANALKSGLASLINPSEKSAKFLGKLGINIKGLVEANKGDIKGTVVGFARALDELDPLNRARAIEQLFGKFQFARLSTLFQNVTKDGSQASRAFKLAGASVEELAILSEREMKKIEDSTGVKFQAALENIKKEIMPLGKAFLEALTPVVKFFSGLLEKFNGLGDNTKKVIAIIVAAVAGLGPILLMTFGLLMNGVANVIKLFALLRGGIAKLNGQTSVMGAGFNYMTQEQIENAASSQQLHQTHTRLIEVFNVEKASVNALASSYNSLSTQMRAMATANPSLFAGGAPGAARAVKGLPPVRKYKEGVLSVPGPKGAGDVVPAMLSPGEAVIPTETTNKYRGLISAMFQDKVPGFMAGRLPGGPGRGIPLSDGPAAVRKAQQAKYRRQNDARQGWNEPHPEAPKGPVFVGMPRSADKASQSRQILDKISEQVSLGRFGTMPASNFGTKLQGFSGYSFPERGIGGVYRKPNGKIVVVKPTIDEKTALAEVRMTQIEAARGMIVPKQQIRTMIDPTDPTGKRKFIVIESPYDPRFANMDGKFTKNDMVKQLVGSTLRGDKDLQRSNVSGNRVPDVGNAGAFDRASGFRDYSKQMPSMEEQAMINLLGVKGGAKKDFALSTAPIAAKMTPKEYDDAIKGEINRSIPKVEKLIKSWEADLLPEEKIVYNNMLERLKAGAKVEWDQFQPIHARAGQGVIKAIKGIDPAATNSEVTKQQSLYEIAALRDKSKTQIDRLVTQLNQDIENTLKELKNTNPAQYKKAIALLEKSGVTPKPDGSIDFKKSKIYSDFISKDLVHKDGAFHTAKAIEKGQSPTTSGKSYDAIRDQILYRMGAAPKPGKEAFSNKPFTPGRLHEDLTSTTQSGGWRSNIDRKSDLYKALDAAEKEHKARNVQNPKNVALNKLRTQMLADGYSVKQIDAMLRTELSHLAKTGEAGLGPEKWKSGFAKFDLRLLNSYVNPGGKPGQPVQNPRLAKILNWDARNGNVLFNATQTAELKKALEFIKTGAHPITESQARLVQAAANAQVEADRYLTQYKEQNSGTKPKGFPDLGSIRQAKAVSTLLSDRLGGGYYQGTPTIYRLGPGSVLAQPGEYLADLENRTADKLSVGNTQSRPMGASPSTGKPSDNLTVEETQTKRVVTKDQARKGGFKMRGRDAGDPSVKLTPYQRQELKKIATKYPKLSETQLMDTLRRKLKADENIIKSKEKEGASAAKAARRAEQLPKQQAAQQARLDRIERDRQTRIIQASKDQDKANKMNRAIDSKKQRMLRQEKAGRWSGGASMALGTAGMGLMMAGQQGAGMAAMGASAVAGLAPMLAGMSSFGLALTALVTVGGGLFILDKMAKKAAESQSKFVDRVTATTEQMASIGEITDKVGASELYKRKRQQGTGNRFTAGFERGKEQFGETFLSSEVGKAVYESFKKNLTAGGIASAKQISLQLAAYVSDGVMSAEQAHSVASQIGIELNNSTLTSQISGNLLELIGPEGQDLKTDPLNVRVNLVREQGKINDDVVKGMQDAIGQDYQWWNPAKFFAPVFTESAGEKAAATTAALGVSSLELAQAQQDSLSKYYDTQIEVLRKQKEITSDKAKQKKIDDEITALEDRKKDGLNTLRQESKKLLNDQVANFKKAKNIGIGGDDYYSKAFMNSVDTQVRTKFEGDPYADVFLGSAKNNLKSEELEVKIKTFIAYEGGTPEVGTSLISMFGKGEKNEAQLDAALDLLITQDSAETIELVNSLSILENKEDAKAIFIDIIEKNPEDRSDLIDAIGLVQKLQGKEINIDAFFSSKDEDGNPIDPMAKLEDLTKALKAIDEIKGPITKQVLMETNEIGGVSLEGLLPIFDQWKNEPESVKRTVVAQYIAIHKTITDGDVSAARAKKMAGLPSHAASLVAQSYAGAEGDKKIRNEIAADILPQMVNQELASQKANKLLDDDTGGGKKVDPFESILARLKNVRNAAIDAAGGIKELNKALAAGNSKSVQDKFRGVEQQLNAQGRNRQFIDFVTSQDPKEQAKYFATAGSKIKTGKNKGRILDPYNNKKLLPKTAQQGDVVLSKLGEDYNKYFDAAVVGEFNAYASKSILLLNEQEAVRRKLVAAGYDAVSIENILQDEYTTAAIATGKITEKELKTNVELSKQLTNRQKINNLIAKGSEALNQQKNIKQIPDVIKFLGSQGVSSKALKDIIGDPESLAEAIAAMEDYKSGAAGAADRLKEIVAGLKAIQANSNIKIALEFAVKNVADQIRDGADAATKVMDSKRTVYSYLNRSQLESATSAYRDPNKAPQQVGKIATANVAARYKAAGVAIPTIPAGASLNSIGKERASLGKTIDIASSNLQSIQRSRSEIQDKIANAQNDLEKALDAVNNSFDQTIKGIEDVIKKYENNIKSIEKSIKAKEDEIKTKFIDKIEAFNKENQMLNNDLAIMDKAAEDINEKYDKQVEALQQVNDLNQQIIDSQGQQLDLADALSQGDIAAAARVAQEMRAASANSQADMLMQGVELSRTNELGALTGAESKMTRDEISERQFVISQEIYKLETDPARLAIEKEIEALNLSILRIQESITLEQEKIEAQEVLRAAALKAAEAAHIAAVANLKAQEASLLAQEKTQAEILKKLEAQDLELASQEAYLQSIADEAVAIDETTGMTLEKWQETVDKITAADELAKSYAIALAAAETAAANTSASWSTILETINKIPKSVETDQIINEIRNITENITRYVTTIDLGGSGGNDGKTGSDKTGSGADAAKAAAEKAAADAAKASADAAAKKVADALAAQKAADAAADARSALLNDDTWWSGTNFFRAKGGLINPTKFAMGGFSKGTDTVPAMLTPGEFVVRKSAVDQYGQDFLSDINVQRFSTGGPVGAPHSLGMSSMGSAKPKIKKEEKTLGGSGPNKDKPALKGFKALFNKEIWESTANFFSLPAMAKTGFDIAKYGGIPQMYAAKLAGMPMKSTLEDNLTTALNVVPIPVVKMAKPIIKKVSGLLDNIAKPFKEFMMPGANPAFSVQEMFLKGLETGKSRMGWVSDAKAAKNKEAILKDLNQKLDDAGYERSGNQWIKKGTGRAEYNPDNILSDKDPLWDTVGQISRTEMFTNQREAKNAGYYASVLGASLKKAKDRISKVVPTVGNLIEKTGVGYKIPGQISESSLQIGQMLEMGERGINTTVRAVLDGVPGFYKTGIDHAEVKREVFGSAFARASNLLAPKNVAVVRKGKGIADGVFSPDVANQGGVTLRSLQDYNPVTGALQKFDKVKDAATAASSGYRTAIMSALRFVDNHDGNLVMNPETLTPGLIDFGRVLDFNPFLPNSEDYARELASPLYNAFGIRNKGPVITNSYLSGVEKGIDFLSTLKSKHIKDMLKSAGYTGKELKQKTAYAMESIEATVDSFPTIPIVTPGLNDYTPGFYTDDILGSADDGLKFLDNASSKIKTTPKFSLAKVSAAVGSGIGLSALSAFKASEANADNYFPTKPESPYDANNNPTGSPSGKYWGELERLYQGSPLGFDSKGSPIFNNTGKDPWGGTEIPGLAFSGKVPDFSDYFHQLAEQPKKNLSLPLDVDKSLMPLVGSGASMGGSGNGFYGLQMFSKGGLVPSYFAQGGYASGTDTVPAMLTPGEFVMSKYAVDAHGADTMRAINNGSSVGDSVYNYSINVNVTSDSNPDEIARAVMAQIKSVDSQKIRGVRI